MLVLTPIFVRQSISIEISADITQKVSAHSMEAPIASSCHTLSPRFYLGDIWKHTVEKNQTNATNVNNVKQFGETFENAQWRKVIHMQPIQHCILTGKPFEDSFENPQWRKVKQMQPL